jgi:hypothetical protein
MNTEINLEEVARHIEREILAKFNYEIKIQLVNNRHLVSYNMDFIDFLFNFNPEKFWESNGCYVEIEKFQGHKIIVGDYGYADDDGEKFFMCHID